MKSGIRFLLSACMLLLAIAMHHLGTVKTQVLATCSTPYDQCIAPAQSTLNSCKAACTQNNPPNSTALTNCNNSCQTIYNKAANMCTSQENTCLSNNAQACEQSSCPIFCEPGIVQEAVWIDGTASCGCTCYCDPGDKPACPVPLCLGTNWGVIPPLSSM